MAHLDLGGIYYIQRKYEQAITKLQYIIDLPPDENYESRWSAYTHRGLGLVYREQGKVEEALAKFQQAMKTEVNPDVEPAWVNRCQGYIYLTKGQLDDALTEFQQVTTIDSENASGYYNLACVYSLKNEPKLAIESPQKAFDLGKSFIEFSKTDPDLDNI